MKVKVRFLRETEDDWPLPTFAQNLRARNSVPAGPGGLENWNFVVG